MILENKMVVVALPGHTCDRRQPLDVSIFGPLKHVSNRVIEEANRTAPELYMRYEKLEGLQIWEYIGKEIRKR